MSTNTTECDEFKKKSIKFAKALLGEINNKHTRFVESCQKIKVLELEKVESEEKLAKLVVKMKTTEEMYRIDMVKLTEELNNEKKMVEEKNQMLLVLEKDKSTKSLEFIQKINDLESDKKMVEEEKKKYSEKIHVLEKEIIEMKEILLKMKEKINGSDNRAPVIIDLIESDDEEVEIVKDADKECSRSVNKKRKRNGDIGEEDEQVSEIGLSLGSVVEWIDGDEGSVSSSRDQEKRWKYATDLLWELNRDPQLCMSAVCALYRQQFFSQDSIECSEDDSSSGTKYAEYLIDSDPENRLSRSVSDVSAEKLKVCEELAMRYHIYVFGIYESKSDPYFPFK